ncbi:methyltransferase family protein [Beggiatoa alba B18LD]|uniref:Methyltransferase family protein n=1 Tax=Beggiatoa alba B18LD TaxID=395493 RepID=I3CJR3_9GAMM|nr:methyltransferase domain-containing protein [Beggiatoa alba]EIJ43856.1 methyltransferase family protein [Beggiatoa alba B18LD]
MIPRTLRQLYYTLARYPMKINGLIYKHFRCPSHGLKVQLGPGRGKYLEGWLNLDANLISAKLDVWADLRDPLPFKDNAVDVLFSNHVIEHLPDPHIPQHFAELFRVIRAGGGIRVGVPHLGNACRKYVEGDSTWFIDYPDKRESLGGRFINFIFCRSEHLTAFDETYLCELIKQAGFVDIQICMPTRTTSLQDLGVGENVFAKEFESDFVTPHTLTVEARKPL